MKKWNEAEVVTLELNATEHNWTGIYRDGGYIGDGEVSGHLSWTKDEPVNPSEPVVPEEVIDQNS